MALVNVIGRCKRHDAIDAVPLFEHTLCVNSPFACKCDRFRYFSTSDRHEYKISNGFILFISDVHGALNNSESQAKRKSSFILHANHCGS